MSTEKDPRWDQIAQSLDELIGWIDTNLHGCVEVEERGEKARKALETLRRDIATRNRALEKRKAQNQDRDPASEPHDLLAEGIENAWSEEE